MYKIEKKVANIDALAELLKEYLNGKFEVRVENADKGLKKLFTDKQTDVIYIKKNAYHGAWLTLGENMDALDHQMLEYGVYVPNALLNQVVGHTGIIDRLVCNLIFGKGDDLYKTIDKFITENLAGKKFKTSDLIKEAFKGRNK